MKVGIENKMREQFIFVLNNYYLQNSYYSECEIIRINKAVELSEKGTVICAHAHSYMCGFFPLERLFFLLFFSIILV